ncbi:MAG: DUF5615 family PIN-like protein [Acidimicrobiia bacterium]|nr:DUF5615 family PIN-like protein [Acidimicrobiia bacterium]
MRFLLDESIARLAMPALREAGHDVVDVDSLGLTSAADPNSLQAALDDDWGTRDSRYRLRDPPCPFRRRAPERRLAARRSHASTGAPGRVAPREPGPGEGDLDAGALVVTADGRVRVRRSRSANPTAEVPAMVESRADVCRRRQTLDGGGAAGLCLALESVSPRHGRCGQ